MQAAAAPQLLLIPIGLIDESPTNPRQNFNPEKLQELADDIKANKLIHALLVRPKGERFELVCGARRLRACHLAGELEVPCTVRELSDLEVIERQLVENAKREDVDPIEDADAVKRMHEAHDLPAEEIAKRLGRSRTSIYDALKLAELGEAGRTALRNRRISASVALYVARLHPTVQPQAVDAVSPHGPDDPPLSAREAAEVIRTRFHIDLELAPFSTADKKLVEEAGTCEACPKRSGNMEGSPGGADVCTDSVCFDAKVDAFWERKKATAEKKGLRILTEDEADSGEWQDPTEVCLRDPHRLTYNALLPGGQKKSPASAFVREGRVIREVWPYEETWKLLAKHYDWAKPPKGGEPGEAQRQPAQVRDEAEWKKEDEKRRKQLAKDNAARDELRCRVIDAAEEGKSDEKLWRTIAATQAEYASFGQGEATALLKRLGFNEEEHGQNEADAIEFVRRKAATLPLAQVRGIAAELCLEQAWRTFGGFYDAVLEAFPSRVPKAKAAKPAAKKKPAPKAKAKAKKKGGAK